jgi:hypothetical protein
MIDETPMLKSETFHRYLDETGDTTFYGKGRKLIVGQDGVSLKHHGRESDYLCWAVQSVFEQGEVRHYNYLAEKIRLVVDLYDRDNYEGNRNYYSKKNPLTTRDKLGPHVT